ncbi:MAG: urea carboxylase-associated family protein [Pseudomonadota bacterium]
MVYDPAIPDGPVPAVAAAPEGRVVPGRRYEIPAREGRAVRLPRGAVLAIENPAGTQVCDFFALVDGSPAEMLGMEQTRTALGRVYVREGDILCTNRRRAAIEILEDSAGAPHDILIACCDAARYEMLGATGYHANCADNFRASLSAIGVRPVHVPCPFNIWMNIPVAVDGGFRWEAPASAPGAVIRLRAHLDLVAVMSACPQDMTPVNGRDAVLRELAFTVER